MKVLLIHPEDGLLDGPWATSRWDRVIDLGRSGVRSYAEAASRLRCPITTLDSFRSNFQEIRKVRDLLGVGLGKMVDECGLDWWELTAILTHQQLELVVLLRELVRTLEPGDTVHVSRPGLHATALETILPCRPFVYAARTGPATSTIRHLANVISKLPGRQLWEIFWDKADPGYQFRGRFTATPKPSDSPLILLPTAYVNASRMGIAYARSLPDAKFRLVATRPSGWLKERPANVSMAWLRSYASLDCAGREGDLANLLSSWHKLRRELQVIEEFRVLDRAGVFDDFPRRLAHGLEIRDAWRNLLDAEPVQSVVCADDSNPNTHVPLLLANQRQIPTVTCHHGALDGRYMFKRVHADVILAKGRMEEDYLVRVCGVPKERVEIGAPEYSTARDAQKADRQGDRKPYIVFFSEPYETAGARGRDIYLDILPWLAELALAEKCELVVKLHPFESLAERRRIVAKILRPDLQRTTHIRTGPLQPDLLQKTRFAVTILSTVAVECAIRGVSCFLCKWLEFSPYGYIDQFRQFGVGINLDREAEISEISRMLALRCANGEAIENCWQPILPDRLKALLQGSSPAVC